MLDPKLLRADLDAVVSQLARKGMTFDRAHYLTLEADRKRLQLESESLANRRKEGSKQIGQLMQAGKIAEADAIKEEMANIGEAISAIDAHFSSTSEALDELLLHLPNLPDASVPDGFREEENVVAATVGSAPDFAFEPKDHVALGELHRGIDFERASRLSGSRFVVMQDGFARLHRALGQYMLDLHSDHHGYQETTVPYLVDAAVLEGTGQLPKFKEDLFCIPESNGGGRERYLIPTAEVPLTNLFRETIVDAQALPFRLVAHTPCFRAEAGSYGRDVRGMFRQHQFDKVELVWITHPASSWDALEQLRGHAEAVLQGLGLHYRVLNLCGGDLGFSVAKTYDLEVWLPGQQQFREISSCSNCTDFQARRMQARMRDGQGKPELVHTLNGSGVAIGRCLIAVIENYQQADGSINIPDVLVPYMGTKRLIPPQ